MLLLLGLVFSGELSVATVGQAQLGPRVRVGDGVLQGNAAHGVDSFKGIPFAAAPVGEGRWQPPQAEKPWRGVRSATRFAPACMQDLVRSQLPWTAEFMPQGKDSEDCLYLNVGEPAHRASQGETLPVYVSSMGEPLWEAPPM